MLVNSLLENSAEKYPDKTALVTQEGRFSYREINNLADKLANSFLLNGLKKGDRVVIFMNNSMEAVVSIFGVLKAGGVFIVINSSTKSEKINYILNNSRATFFIGELKKLSVFTSACNDSFALRNVYLAGDKSSPKEDFQKNVLRVVNHKVFVCLLLV